MLLYQKHGENLETDPPTYGCLHPRWQKQHKHKQLSKEEWSAPWQIEQLSIEPMNAKSSGHMTTLDKWTVSCKTSIAYGECHGHAGLKRFLQAWCGQHHQALKGICLLHRTSTKPLQSTCAKKRCLHRGYRGWPLLPEQYQLHLQEAAAAAWIC